MGLSHEIISQFAKIVNNDNKKSSESTVYGTVKTDANGNKYVQLDGSDQLTPLTEENQPSVDTALAKTHEGDRVSVLIKDHTATVTGNISSPAVSDGDVETAITKFDIAVGEQIQADKAYFKELTADKANMGNLVAAIISVAELIANDADIEKLIADEATITDLVATKIDADIVIADTAIVEHLKGSRIDVLSLIADKAVMEDLIANNADLNSVEAKNAYLKYANIDFSNIGEAAITKLFTDSGIIEDLVVSEGKITGELVGVTIKGDLIEAGTLKADRLVVKGSDGNYYALSTDFTAMPGVTPVEEDSIHGSVLVKKSIVAEKIAVDDLVAFGATIGGFKIDNNSIHSVVKDSVDNTTRGIYMDNDGQFAVGDNDNYIKYYKTSDGSYKLDISADEMRFSSSKKTVSETIEEVKNDIDTVRDEITTLLRIESSRGTVFKNDQVATVLSVVIYHGKQRITNSDDMKKTFGPSAYLQWKWQRIDDDSFGVILADDDRFGNDGFTFTLSPEDVDTKVTFMCELIV